MNELLSISLVIIILVLAQLLWKYVSKSKNCQEDNVKLLEVASSFKKERDTLRTFLKHFNEDVSQHTIKLEDNYFYFKALEDYTYIDIEAIRFKKKDDKVLIYLNGAMTPTNASIYIINPHAFNKDMIKVMGNISTKTKDIILSQDSLLELEALIK